MSPASDDKPEGDKNYPPTIRVVLQVRRGAGAPFEGTVEMGTSVPRVFRGWLELMGQLEEARADGGQS
jgi:hypothetical protein